MLPFSMALKSTLHVMITGDAACSARLSRSWKPARSLPYDICFQSFIAETRLALLSVTLPVDERDG